MTDRRLVHIVDDEDAIRRSASFMLKTSGFDVQTWPSGVAFLKEARTVPVGCILLDVRMPVIVLTGHGDISVAVRAMKAGAVDFIEKPFEKATLFNAIEAAFERLRDQAGRAERGQEASITIASLTTREREVLAGLAQGLPNKTIAFDLGISPRTVEVHRANVMSKLNVRSLSDALRIAFAAGLGADRE